ncbi:unnamed protein product [Bursaphelenchus okinawaensis]|uniref:Uncharacterized protein n=1 Tax=Bursaphelenchus okinawaensis TaxID=465554 RepID=A0A811L087_9BILA|nr:unnamed protein product [Bursaphelenchus okinawaensis]CAG9115146.1 unnamed protein product [Bursaphelenchus okinawaensis]
MSIKTVTTALKSFGYKDELNENIVEKSVKSDIVLFSRVVGWLAGELHVLLQLENTVEEIENVNQEQKFVSELSAFLSEYEGETVDIQASKHGDLSTDEGRLKLLQYLLSQVKPARLIALKRLQKQRIDELSKPSDPLKELARILVLLNIRPDQVQDQHVLMDKFKSEVQKTFNGLVRRPKPIFNGKFNDKQWSQLNTFAQNFTKDYKVRTEMLLKRLDITIESFLWSDKVHQLEKSVMKAYLPERNTLGYWKPIGVEGLLGATEDLLIIEKASSSRQRTGTRSKISDFMLNQVPADRGGRTDNTVSPPKETFKNQYKPQQRRGPTHSPKKSGKYHEQAQHGLEVAGMTNRYFSTYVEDLEQDPFDATDFVERLAWRITEGKEDVDVEYLKRKFEEEIGSLQASSENFQAKIQRLEDQRNVAKMKYLDSLQQLHEKNADALEKVKVG